MSNYVSLKHITAPSPERWWKFDGWKTALNCIPLVGTAFEVYRNHNYDKELKETFLRPGVVSLIQYKNGDKIAGAVNDFITTTGFFLLAGYGVDAGLITPVTSYLWGSLCACSLVCRPLTIWLNWRRIPPGVVLV